MKFVLKLYELLFFKLRNLEEIAKNKSEKIENISKKIG